MSAPTNTDTNRATLATEISGGSATPDVFMGDVIWPAQFGAHQLAVPLSDYLPTSYWAQFAPGLVAGRHLQGQGLRLAAVRGPGLHVLPQGPAGQGGHVAADDLGAAGKRRQDPGEQGRLVKYGFVWQGASYEGLTCNFMEYLASAGGTATNSDYTKATLDSPAAVKATTFMRSPGHHRRHPGGGDHVAGAAVDVHLRRRRMPPSCATGTTAYAVADPGHPQLIGKVGVEPMPAFAGQPTPGYSNIGGWNMYINPHSKNLAADLTFIKFLASDEAQTDPRPWCPRPSRPPPRCGTRLPVIG